MGYDASIDSPTFLGAGLGAAFAFGAAAGLPAAGRPPEDFLAATGPDDLEAFIATGAGEEACLQQERHFFGGGLKCEIFK